MVKISNKYRLINKQDNYLILKQDNKNYRAKIKIAVDIGVGKIAIDDLMLDYLLYQEIYLCENCQDDEVYTICIGVYFITVYKELEEI